jgi:hypothetical protein
MDVGRQKEIELWKDGLFCLAPNHSFSLFLLPREIMVIP